MKNLIFYTIVILTAFSTSAFGQSDPNIEGNWLGVLDVGGGIKVRLVFKITKTIDGYAAKLDSPDQGAKDLPIDSITKNDKTVSFSAPRFGMSYEGTLNEKGDEIAGTIKQGSASSPLNLKRSTGEAAVKRPQDPQKPYPYTEEEVSYKNEKDNVKLAGTLTLPRGEGKFPAVVLITGSGAQDRDSTVLGHRPFLVLGDYLTRKGIAVLRVDDRGIGGSDSGSLSATTENFAGDVLAGVEFLKNRSDINPEQIGLIGHSEGGVIAPMAAVRSKDVAFIVMLAGAGQTGADVILTQMALLSEKSGETEENITQAVALQKDIFAIIKSEPDDKPAESKINEMLAKRKSKMNEQELKAFAQTEANIKAQMSLLLSPWYRYFLAYDPRPALEKVKIPVLALNGENDLQISSKENLALISAALEAGKNKDFTVKSFPKLNHLFQTSRTGLPDEYKTIDETIAPQVLETIADWILKRTASQN